MTRWMAMLVCAAALAAGRDVSYKPGSKLTLELASGTRCAVEVVLRRAELVTVTPRKQQTGCPMRASILDLRNVVAIRMRRSAGRYLLSAATMIGGFIGTQYIAFKTESGAATIAALTVTVAGGVAVGQSGYKWTLYLNRSDLDPA